MHVLRGFAICWAVMIPASVAFAEVDQDSVEVNSSPHDIFLQPSSLDFGEQEFNHPVKCSVTVFNNHHNETVDIRSVDSRGSDFYASILETRFIPPQRNASLNLIYLPRRLGNIQSEIIIYTNFGKIKYNVQGSGVPSKYKIAPLIDIQVPRSAVIAPNVVLFNPFETAIRITEIYSSGGPFQLELPEEDRDQIWHIEPYDRKTVIKIRFTSNTPGNFKGFIRVKTECVEGYCPNQQVLIVPIEVEVKPNLSVFYKDTIIDLGSVVSANQTETLSLNLSTVDQLRSDFKIEVIKLNAKVFSLQGTRDVHFEIPFQQLEEVVEFDAKVITANIMKDEKYQYLKGTILISFTKDNSDLVLQIPIQGEVFKGSIFISEIQILVKNNESEIVVNNNLLVPIKVWKAFPPDNTIKELLQDFTRDTPVVIKPAENYQKTLKFSATKWGESINSTMKIQTNITAFEVAIKCFSGQLKKLLVKPFYNELFNRHQKNRDASVKKPSSDHNQWFEQGNLTTIDFGTIGVNTETEKKLVLMNEEPVPIKLQTVKFSSCKLASCSIQNLGCGKRGQVSDLTVCEELMPGDWIVFDIRIQSIQEKDDSVCAVIYIRTDYEEIELPVRTAVKTGVLFIEDRYLSFENCFPTKICTLELIVSSTYQHPVFLEQVVSPHGDFVANNTSKRVAILPNTETSVGWLKFDPKSICLDSCYVGNKETNYMFNKFIENDLELLEIMRRKALKMPFQLVTNEKRHYNFLARISLIWPKLVKEQDVSIVLLPDQEFGYTINIHNPSNERIKYEIIFVDSRNDLVNVPPLILPQCDNCMRKDKLVESQMPRILAIGRHPGYIDADMVHSLDLKIGGSPEPGKLSVALFIRNNLTTLEGVWITVQTVQVRFKFGNRRPGSTTPLLFDINDSTASDNCANSMTTKRSFTAKNNGPVAITISSMKVGDEECASVGFRVINCSGFNLEPNSSRKIEIEFVPDFTLARVSQLLVLETNANIPINYTLLGTVPQNALNYCKSFLKRPWWESKLKMVVLIVLTLVFGTLCLFAYLDTNRILMVHEQLNSRVRGPAQKTFDFKTLNLKSLTTETPKKQQANQTKKKQSRRFVNTTKLFWFTNADDNQKKPETVSPSSSVKPQPNSKSQTLESKDSSEKSSSAKKEKARSRKSKPKQAIPQDLSSTLLDKQPEDEPQISDSPQPVNEQDVDEQVIKPEKPEKHTYSKTPGRERKVKTSERITPLALFNVPQGQPESGINNLRNDNIKRTDDFPDLPINNFVANDFGSLFSHQLPIASSSVHFEQPQQPVFPSTDLGAIGTRKPVSDMGWEHLMEMPNQNAYFPPPSASNWSVNPYGWDGTMATPPNLNPPLDQPLQNDAYLLEQQRKLEEQLLFILKQREQERNLNTRFQQLEQQQQFYQQPTTNLATAWDGALGTDDWPQQQQQQRRQIRPPPGLNVFPNSNSSPAPENQQTQSNSIYDSIRSIWEDHPSSRNNYQN